MDSALVSVPCGLMRERVRVVELEDQRDVARELRSSGLEEPERRGVRVAARLDAQLEVIARVVGRGVLGEAPRRSVLEALVDRQDHELARPAEAAVVQQPRQVRQRARVVGGVPGQDLLHVLGGHGLSPHPDSTLRRGGLQPPAAEAA